MRPLFTKEKLRLSPGSVDEVGQEGLPRVSKNLSGGLDWGPFHHSQTPQTYPNPELYSTGISRSCSFLEGSFTNFGNLHPAPQL